MVEQNEQNLHNSVSEAQNIIGRTDILEKIHGLLSASETNAVALYGSPHIGKTSVLYKLLKYLPEKGRYHLFYHNLKDKSNFYPKAEGGPDQSLLKNFSMDKLSIPFLDQLSNPLAPGISLILLFDEFNTLYTSQYDDTVIFSLKKVLEYDGSDVKVVMNGIEQVCQYDKEQVKFIIAVDRKPDEAAYTLIKDVDNCHISYLTRDETDQLVWFADQSGYLVWNQDILDLIWGLTGGHPYLIQHLCAVITEQAKQNKVEHTGKVVISWDMVKLAVPEILRRSDSAMRRIWEQLSHIDRKVAQVLVKETSVPPKELHSAINLPKNEVDSAIQRLQSWDLVKLTDKSYHFQTELMRQWFSDQPKTDKKGRNVFKFIAIFFVFLVIGSASYKVINHFINRTEPKMIEMGAYSIGKYEVDKASYMKVMQPQKLQTLSDEERRIPITNVSWKESREYAAKIGKRLCTKKEWINAFSYNKNGTIKSAIIGKGINSNPEPVNTEGDISDYEIYNLLGNVQEWINDNGDAATIGLSLMHPNSPNNMKDAIIPIGRFSLLKDRSTGFRVCE